MEISDKKMCQAICPRFGAKMMDILSKMSDVSCENRFFLNFHSQ